MEIKEYLGKDRFAAFVGIKLLETERGYAKAALCVSGQHMNAAGVVQGGAIFTLADYTMAAAANAQGQVALAVNATISYFSAPRGEQLTAEAREVSASRRLAHYNVDIFDSEGSLFARMTGIVYRKSERIV